MNLSAPTKLKKHEQVLIQIDDCSWLTVIPLISAVQAYALDGQKKHAAFCSFRKVEPDFSVAIDILMPMAATKFEMLFKQLVPDIRWVFPSSRLALDYSIYDCIFDLSEEKARKIGGPTNRHLAQSYGIMLGSEAQSLPLNVENLCQGYTKSDKIITSFEFIQKAPHRSLAHLPDTMFITRDESDLAQMMGLSRSLTVQERVRQVFECDGVIDVTSFETHLASCLEKPVLELSTDPALSKYSNPNYHCFTEMTKASFERGLTLCFPSLLQR